MTLTQPFVNSIYQFFIVNSFCNGDLEAQIENKKIVLYAHARISHRIDECTHTLCDGKGREFFVWNHVNVEMAQTENRTK